MPWFAAAIASYRSTSMCRAVRRLRKHCCTASFSCRTKSAATRRLSDERGSGYYGGGCNTDPPRKAGRSDHGGAARQAVGVRESDRRVYLHLGGECAII